MTPSKAAEHDFPTSLFSTNNEGAGGGGAGGGGVFNLVLCRQHCMSADSAGVERKDAKAWDTVKPIGRYFKDINKVVLIDDSPNKAIPGEERQMLNMPRWAGPELGKFDICLLKMVNRLLQMTDVKEGHLLAATASAELAREVAPPPPPCDSPPTDVKKEAAAVAAATMIEEEEKQQQQQQQQQQSKEELLLNTARRRSNRVTSRIASGTKSGSTQEVDDVVNELDELDEEMAHGVATLVSSTAKNLTATLMDVDGAGCDNKMDIKCKEPAAALVLPPPSHHQQQKQQLSATELADGLQTTATKALGRLLAASAAVLSTFKGVTIQEINDFLIIKFGRLTRLAMQGKSSKTKVNEMVREGILKVEDIVFNGNRYSIIVDDNEDNDKIIVVVVVFQKRE